MKILHSTHCNEKLKILKAINIQKKQLASNKISLSTEDNILCPLFMRVRV